MKSKFDFISCDGRTKIKGFKWMPENMEIKGVLQIIHGMVEYIERYDEFAEFMAQNGYLVFGYDQLGHGASVKNKDDRGYIGENPRELLLGDIDKARKIFQKEYEGKPYFIMGHSMGSYELRNYIAEKGEGLSGAIIVGTGYVEKKDTNRGKRLVKTLAMIKGWEHRSIFITKLAFSGQYKQYDLTGKDLSNSWLTRDEKLVKAYYDEPRCGFIFSLNGYMALFKLVEFACNKDNMKNVPKNLPILIASGEDDPVGDMGDGVLKVYHMFRDYQIEDLKCHIYDGYRHEILNEIGREKVYDDILNWMDKRI